MVGLHFLIGRFTRPVLRLIDYSALLAMAPRRFALGHVRLGESRNFRAALVFFLTAVSTGLVIDKVGFLALGGGALNEIYYWVLTLILVAAFVLLLSVPLSIGRSPQFTNVLHVSLFTIGASCFVASLFFALGALAILGLYSVGYIPNFVMDPAAFGNFEAIAMNAYRECMADQNLLMRVILGANFSVDTIIPPISYLPYVRTAIFAFYIIPLVMALAHLLKRSALLVGGSAFASLALLVLAMAWGIVKLDERVYQNTDCSKISIDVAVKHTTASQLRRLAEGMASTFKQESSAGVVFKKVEVDGRSLVVTIEVDTVLVGPVEMKRRIEAWRLAFQSAYCEPGKSEIYKQLDVNWVHVLRSFEGKHLDTFTISRDQCRT